MYVEVGRLGRGGRDEEVAVGREVVRVASAGFAVSARLYSMGLLVVEFLPNLEWDQTCGERANMLFPVVTTCGTNRFEVYDIAEWEVRQTEPLTFLIRYISPLENALRNFVDATSFKFSCCLHTRSDLFVHSPTVCFPSCRQMFASVIDESLEGSPAIYGYCSFD